MLDKIDKNFYILGGNGLEWYEKGINTNKQYKISKRNTYYCAKNKCLFSRRPYLDLKEVKILKESDVLENIIKGIMTRFEIKAVKHEKPLFGFNVRF